MRLKKRVEKLERMLNFYKYIGGSVRYTPQECIESLCEENSELRSDISKLAKAAGLEWYNEPPKQGFREIKKESKND